jgi:hypothetical protein
LQPSTPVDLYAGQDLILLARYNGSGDARIRLEGRSADGPITWTTRTTFPGHERGNPFVARLWAAQRLGWLAAEKRKNGATSEVDAEIKALGEKYGIPTEFSSYLVVEPGMQVAGGQRNEDLRRRASNAPVPAPAPGDPGRGAGRLDAVVATGAAQRFEAAKSAAVQREAKSLAVLDSASFAPSATMHRVGSRIFSLQNGTWTDARYVPTMRTVRVKAYSSLYFDLVQRLAGLGECLAVGDHVIVVGRDVAIEVAPEGAERLSDADLTALARSW